MQRIGKTLVPLALVSLALAIPGGASAGGVRSRSTTPRWVLHVEHYRGGISNGVRAQADPEVARAQARYRAARFESTAAVGLPRDNVQMNDDSNPPLPQNEISVDYSRANPLIAVAASNDYVSGGVAIMRTRDGGRTWRTTRLNPQFVGTRDFCGAGGDPSVAYSIRDRAFYLTQLCFFRSQAYSEVHLFKSVDNGKTWTPGRERALVASNFDYSTGTVDDSIFLDKEWVTVDNTPTSPHYGRIYVTYIKFHMEPSGFSDYCPVQLAYTDDVPTFNPSLTVFNHTPVVPDNPGDNGAGQTANQHAYPQVERSGALDIPYALEDCNTGLDRHLEFQKSTDGGASFLPHPIRIDKPGQFKDNPNLDDTLPPTPFRAPLAPSFDINKATGVLAYTYQNNINRAVSGADISVQFSTDGGLHWTDAHFLSVNKAGDPARNDQFFAYLDSDENGQWHAIWLDRRRDPNNHDINTFQADWRGVRSTFTNYKISTTSWNPDRSFFTSGAFIGDYNGLAASTAAVYPAWVDARDSAIDRTGIGESDIFTNVEIR